MNDSSLVDTAKALTSLRDAAMSVFAEMVFMDAEPLPAAPGLEAYGPDAVHVALDVLKPLSCRLELLMPRALVDRIADTLFGEAEADFSPQEATPQAASNRSRDDSVLEMLNVFAGGFLSNYYGPGTPFKLELPFFIFGEADVTGPVMSSVPLDVEGLPAELILRSIRYRY